MEMAWISVEDRLPEEPLQTVIVSNRRRRVCVAVYSVVDGVFGVMCGRGEPFGVTHWMPLPEPPEERS